jgi:hypothetical protein
MSSTSTLELADLIEQLKPRAWRTHVRPRKDGTWKTPSRGLLSAVVYASMTEVAARVCLVEQLAEIRLSRRLRRFGWSEILHDYWATSIVRAWSPSGRDWEIGVGQPPSDGNLARYLGMPEGIPHLRLAVLAPAVVRFDEEISRALGGSGSP